VVHQQRKKFPEDIPDNKHQTQHRYREKDVDQQFTADKSVDQLHLSIEISTTRIFLHTGRMNCSDIQLSGPRGS